MFDSAQAEELKHVLPMFDLSRPLNSASLAAPVMHNYLEFYGFYETLKTYDVDYFWGIRLCSCGPGQRRVATHYWRLQESRGTVFFVHGLFDHVGIYQKLTAYLLAQGYSVIGIDLPGHGISEGGPTQIASFSDYADVIRDNIHFFKDEIAGSPFFGVGQSTGAAVLMTLCFDQHKQGQSTFFDRLVFLGPLVQPRKWLIGRWAYRLFGRFIKYVQRDLSVPNSHDTEFHNFLRYYDCLQPRRLCITWIGALHHWVETFALQPIIDTPVLIIQGTADTVVDWRHNTGVIQQHYPQSQINYIEGAMHHLANEADPWRKAIYNGMGQFFRQAYRNQQHPA